MIIWLNGAFGAGKTTAAYELHRRLAGSLVYDPEEVGYFLRRSAPCFRTPDFQDLPLWRALNYELLREIDAENPGDVIVPMTLVNAQYYHEIVVRLQSEGVCVRHFILYASRETILKRLRRRSLGLLRREGFAVAAIDRCLHAFDTDAIPGMRIDTDRMSVSQVVETVAERCEIALQPDSRSVARRSLDRLGVWLRHIRG